MSSTVAGGHPRGFAGTLRTDAWWLGPLLTVIGLTAFFGYGTVRAFEGAHYYAEPYLSPFFSPLVFVDSAAPGAGPVEHSLFGEWPAWWPDFFLLPASPAIFILVFPGAFRITCYYYRKAYYRSFAGLPPGCAVNPVPLKRYRGETRLLLFQNLHRYALYAAVVFIFILAYDAWLAFWNGGEFGFGVGTFILLVNPILLGAYTFGCHSWRHLIGGRLDCFSCDGGAAKLAHGAWKGASWLNSRHMLWAWVSLIWVGLADVYVTLVSRGVIHDINTWGWRTS